MEEACCSHDLTPLIGISFISPLIHQHPLIHQYQLRFPYYVVPSTTEKIDYIDEKGDIF